MSPTRRSTTVAVAAAATTFAVVLLVAGVVAASLGPGRRSARPAGPARAAPGGPLSERGPRQSPSLRPVAPALAAAPDTPVQQQYDAALASGLSSSPSARAAEAAQVPAPAFNPDWPPLPPSYTPGAWAAEFTQRVLGIDFAHQSRSQLGGWLSGEEAPELLPGVPPGVADKVLYLSLFDPAAVGGGGSPIPDQPTWQAHAAQGQRWSVSDVMLQPDPRYSQVVADGWQPADQRFSVDDVSGLLRVTGGASSTTKHFTMVVYLGSAHWHPGYGTVLVDDWKET